MPQIIEISDLPPRERPLHVWAVMWFPHDATLRQLFFEAARNTIVRNMLVRTEMESIYDVPEALPFIVAAATGNTLQSFLAEHKNYLYTRDLLRPALAGLILFYVLACSAAPETGEPATLSHAIDVIISGAGKRSSIPGLSRISVLRLWREFGPVAHLNAVKLFYSDLWIRSGDSLGR